MSEHTPGPWRIEPHTQVDKCFYAGPARLDYDDVCHEEQDANAALIAAAPDLLAACLAVAAEHDKYSDVGLATIGKVQAAIAKAIQKAEPNA